MAKLNLSIAVRDYDRTRPLTDGTVQIDGVDPVFMALDPEEIFFRAFRHAEFDICELSLSSSTVKTAQGDFAYVGIPAFVSRAFRHTSIYVRTDRVKQPADLKGRKVGVSEYQLTANDEGYDLAAAIAHLRARAQVPIYTGLPFGHVRDKLTLPVGGRCMLETRDGMARLTLSHYA